MINTGLLKYLDIVKVASLPESNNVRVTFYPTFVGEPIEKPVVIGKKQLVLLLEKLAADPIVKKFEQTRERARHTAESARRVLWPKTL